MRRSIFLIIIFNLFQISGFAQQNRQLIDSLISVLKTEKEDTTKIKLLVAISEEYSSFSKDSAILYATAGYNLSLKLNSDELKFQSSNSLSTRYSEKGINDKALEFALLALKFAEASGNKKHIIVANEFLSDLYTYNLRNLQKALEYGKSALSIAKATGDTNSIIKNLSALSTVYFNFGNFDEALIFSNEQYKTALISRDSVLISAALADLGDCYRAKKNFEQALTYYKSAIDIVKGDSNNFHLATLYNNIAIIYERIFDYKTAINYHLASIDIAKKYKIENLVSYYHKNTSDSYFKARDYKNALRYNLLSIQYEEATGSLSELKGLYLSNAEINDSLHNYKAALEALNKYVAINNDSINNETRNKVSEMEVALESEKKQKEIDLINKDKERQKIIRNSFIVGSLLLVLLIIVLINRNKLKRTVEMERMRSRLSRDLHDDIGSTLSSINILSRTAQSNLQQTHPDASGEKTKASLEKINERSQRLLDNMRDIIWNINPGNDTIEEVMSRMREYATTILEAKNIDYTFNFPKEKMDCKLSMEIKNNMYLIFKEAVNNLVKYSVCTTAKFELTFDEKNIHLKIEDNGKGFSADEIQHRGGLGNMQHRAEEINGSIKINSIPGIGTCIELNMPRYC